MPYLALHLVCNWCERALAACACGVGTRCIVCGKETCRCTATDKEDYLGFLVTAAKTAPPPTVSEADFADVLTDLEAL